MAQHLMPFGVGTRICGGQNLAQIVLRVALAAFVANSRLLRSHHLFEAGEDGCSCDLWNGEDAIFTVPHGRHVDSCHPRVILPCVYATARMR